MEDDVMVGGIRLVVVVEPVAGAEVDFHVAHPELPVYLHLSIEKVGTCIVVVQSRVNHLHSLPPCGPQGTQRKYLVLPHILQQFFHNLFCSIDDLD